MITPQELRVGNWVNDVGSVPYQIMPNDIVALHQCQISGKVLLTINPIPLTPEWLVRFGFLQGKGKWGNDFYILNEDGFTVMFSVEHWTDVEETSVWKNHWFTKGLLNKNKLQFVHQLQNLFFALTGKELILDSKPEISTSSTAPDSTSAK